MAEKKQDARISRVGVSGSTIVREGRRKFTKKCANGGARHPFRSFSSATRAEKLKTFCKSCSAVRNIQRYNGKVREEFGVRLSWLRTYHVGAKARGLSFEIEAKDVRELYDEQQGLCALSGQPIILPLSSKYASVTASIDRIDNSIGYIRSNVQLVHKQVNMLRGSLCVDDFIHLCKMIADYN